jgi:DNA processing protein
LRDAGISFISRGSAAYPGRLARFDDAPPWLFVKGSPDELPDPTIGIVGSRSCTSYGRALAEAYGLTASEAGWSVVSGLARGIDAAAHTGAIAGPTPCVGVVGSGIDIIYPAENWELYGDLLAAGGRVVSEYPPGTRPDGWRFPTRNRIIAGLSEVILVVEATHTGGALITARVALDYGVPIYAVPGDVDRPTSQGTNALIRDGAFPIFGPDDLAEVLNLVQPLVV